MLHGQNKAEAKSLNEAKKWKFGQNKG